MRRDGHPRGGRPARGGVRLRACPDIAERAHHYLHARATDTDALKAFGPRDGRTRLLG